MAFINGIGIISPQKTFETNDFLVDIQECHADYLKCTEPVYRNYIEPIQARRMSRLIKMGIASAKMSLAEAACTMPDAIITGTGLGSVEDTEKILAEITREERFLNPTPFIQSTYNTISSQVAIQLKCHNYNSTYVHRTFSFESGLDDALLQMAEGSASDILVGAIDEMTMNHLRITRRTGLWKMEPISNLSLLADPGPGAMAGEGAAFFTLGRKRTGSTYAELLDVRTVIAYDGQPDWNDVLPGFLRRHALQPNDIDLLLLGLNGDVNSDPVYLEFAEKHFPRAARCWFKHLCGEYHTATGFGLYIASNILKRQIYPEILNLPGSETVKPASILIYNQYRNVNHSLILVRVAGDA